MLKLTLNKPTTLFKGYLHTEQEAYESDDDIRSIHNSSNTITQHSYGFRNIMYLPPNSKHWLPLSSDPDKFIILNENKPLARSEFWIRWSKYIKTRFNLHFAPIIEC